jgi:hypothetical protein
MIKEGCSFEQVVQIVALYMARTCIGTLDISHDVYNSDFYRTSTIEYLKRAEEILTMDDVVLRYQEMFTTEEVIKIISMSCFQHDYDIKTTDVSFNREKYEKLSKEYFRISANFLAIERAVYGY